MLFLSIGKHNSKFRSVVVSRGYSLSLAKMVVRIENVVIRCVIGYKISRIGDISVAYQPRSLYRRLQKFQNVASFKNLRASIQVRPANLGDVRNSYLPVLNQDLGNFSTSR